MGCLARAASSQRGPNDKGPEVCDGIWEPFGLAGDRVQISLGRCKMENTKTSAYPYPFYYLFEVIHPLQAFSKLFINHTRLVQ